LYTRNTRVCILNLKKRRVVVEGVDINTVNARTLRIKQNVDNQRIADGVGSG
jgi:ribosomal protein L24